APDALHLGLGVQVVVDLEPFLGEYPERFGRLPDNFDDDLHTKPEVQRIWRWVRNREHFVGSMDRSEPRQWLRQLDYYAWLHERLDDSLATILGALDRLGLYDDTAIVYTSDHGDACGAHGLRAKLPCVYEEVMGVPLTVKLPGVTRAGATTDALSTHVDLARTLCALGGVPESRAAATLSGEDLSPTLADPSHHVRDHVLFAQDSAQSPLLRGCRYAVRGFFDGETKYARYYGIGGGVQRDGTTDEAGKVIDVDAPFDDQDHELYDCADDPGELVNRAHDRGRRQDLRDQFDRLREYEEREFAPLG
ncbi:MAG: sulfatase-like hydrolase/transferase, partial [Actinomycetota bacterium]